MSVARLVRCWLCDCRVHPSRAVMVAGYEAHYDCAEAYYKRLAHAVGCRQEGDQG